MDVRPGGLLGGSLSGGPDDEEIETAAMIAEAGLDAIRFLITEDELEAAAIAATAARTIARNELRDQNLAVRIANAVGERILGG